MVRWVVGSILHGVDPLSYFSFQPVLHDWCNKGRGMCYPVCGFTEKSLQIDLWTALVEANILVTLFNQVNTSNTCLSIDYRDSINTITVTWIGIYASVFGLFKI